MNKIKYVKIAAATLAFFLWPAAALPTYASEHPLKSTDGKQSQVWLVGDSSLHTYSSTANNMTVAFSFDAASSKTVAEQLAAGQLKALEVSIPVKEMRSGKGGLDKNLQKALKAEENPNIIFHMEKFEVAPSTIQSKGFILKALGVLEIAGAKKDVELDGTLTTEGSTARVQGVKDLLMTDYGVKPPKILMIKTSNEVKIHYDLWLDEKGGLK